MDRSRLLAVAVLGLLAAAGLALWLTLDSAATPEPVLLAAPAPAPKLERVSAPPPPVRQRVYHLPKPGEPKPEELPGGSAAAMHPDDTRGFQRAGISAAGRAKDLCLSPWAEEEGGAVEIVMDAVVHDGIIADVQLRTLTEIPQDVLDCVRDAAWAIEWPEADAPGEVRFQHMIAVGTDAPLPEEPYPSRSNNGVSTD